GNDDVNGEGNDIAKADQTEQGNYVVHVGGIDIVADDEAQAIITDKPKRIRNKRKAADGASGLGFPPRKLKEDHGTSGIGASTSGKSVAALQSLLEGSTLAVEVGVAAAATVPFITSSVTLTSERDGPVDSVSETSLRTQHPTKRFVISLDSSHDSNANDADDEVTSIVRSSMPLPPVFTAAVATTTIVGATSAPVHESEVSTDTFFVSQDMDSETLHQVYIPRWNVINESALDDPDVCHSLVNQRAPPLLFSKLRSMDYEQLFVKFNVKATHHTCLGAEVRMLLEHEIREAEAAEAIRLRGQVVIVEAVEAARHRGDLVLQVLDVPTRQILDSKGVVPSMNVANANKAIQEMAYHS
ncbi:hypothetical protein Tco_1357568, partial [Tanacetum coccineum]